MLTDYNSNRRPSQYGAPLLQGKRVDFLGSLGDTARLLGVDIHYNSEVTGYVDSDRPAAYLANGEIHQADVGLCSLSTSTRFFISAQIYLATDSNICSLYSQT